MRFWGRIAAVLVAVAPLIWFSPVHAQTSKNVTVTTCGTPPPGYSPSGAGYTAGGIYPQVMDINGNVCTNSLAAPASYALLTNASSTGPAVSVAGGNYGLDLGGTFGGATVSIAYTLPNQSPVSLGSFTSATNSKTTCLVIPAGATVQATVTGGSPSGLYAQLGGVGSCSATGGSVTVGFVATTAANASSTITTGGTFQSALASNGSRKGCLIQNPVAATETLYVYFGATGSATTANSIALGAGSAVSCAVGGLGVATDNVAVEAATTGHAFVEMSQ